jgi:hypothetical protein
VASTRVPAAERQQLDEWAAEQGTDRAELLRRIIAYARAHMPRHWTPEEPPHAHPATDRDADHSPA